MFLLVLILKFLTSFYHPPFLNLNLQNCEIFCENLWTTDLILVLYPNITNTRERTAKWFITCSIQEVNKFLSSFGLDLIPTMSWDWIRHNKAPLILILLMEELELLLLANPNSAQYLFGFKRFSPQYFLGNYSALISFITLFRLTFPSPSLDLPSSCSRFQETCYVTLVLQ